MNIQHIDNAARILLDGGVGIMPTDTVYGLVARAEDQRAVARLYALKHREHKPGTIIAADTEQLAKLGISKQRLKTIEHLWPNPLSVILVLGQEFAYLDLGVGDIATRVVADTRLQSFLRQTGPLLTTSANHPGKPGAVNILEAQNYFNDQVEFYVDSGDLSGRAPSTIIRLTDSGEIKIIRDGAVKL